MLQNYLQNQKICNFVLNIIIKNKYIGKIIFGQKINTFILKIKRCKRELRNFVSVPA